MSEEVKSHNRDEEFLRHMSAKFIEELPDHGVGVIMITRIKQSSAVTIHGMGYQEAVGFLEILKTQMVSQANAGAVSRITK